MNYIDVCRKKIRIPKYLDGSTILGFTCRPYFAGLAVLAVATFVIDGWEAVA